VNLRHLRAKVISCLLRRFSTCAAVIDRHYRLNGSQFLGDFTTDFADFTDETFTVRRQFPIREIREIRGSIQFS
jgi:hypothetical protein